MAISAPRPLPVPRARPNIDWLPFLALNLTGALAFLHPFFSGATERDSRWFEHSTDAPLVFGALGGLCLVLVVADVASGKLNSKGIAALGVLAAMAAVLRTITLPAGANLFWTLVITGGFAFGPRLGFLLGAFALAMSAIVTSGFGPWMPFQAFGAAWVGLAAGYAGMLSRRWDLHGKPEVALLALVGSVAAIFYGLVINLWSWPFYVAGPDISYEPGLGFADAIRRYANFYVLTSFGWDLAGAVCNVIALALAGGPILRALRRFRERFTWTVQR
jgi:energy-coupling factor transport system substrate-specific component